MSILPVTTLSRYSIPAALLLIGLLAPGPVFPHPHVFADYSFGAVFDERGLVGVEVYWRFDRMFSSQIIDRFDVDKDKRLSKSEQKAVREVAFAELPDVNYFTVLRVDGQPRPVKRIGGFAAWINRGRLCCRFMIPCRVKGAKGAKSVELLVRDEEYFIDFKPDKSRLVKFKHAQRYLNRVTMHKRPRQAYYFGRIVPQVVTISFRRNG